MEILGYKTQMRVVGEWTRSRGGWKKAEKLKEGLQEAEKA
jgi:hypothetical protein